MTVDIQLHLVDVGAERTDGMSVGMADVLSCGSALTANSTYFAHNSVASRFYDSYVAFLFYRNILSLVAFKSKYFRPHFLFYRIFYNVVHFMMDIFTKLSQKAKKTLAI